MTDSFSGFESMLVSSHTVQVWNNKKHVPDRLQKYLVENENYDFVYFIPKVIVNSEYFNKYPLYKSDRRVDLDDGVLFLSLSV
jgi:uncharacterized protein (DUF427 family)